VTTCYIVLVWSRRSHFNVAGDDLSRFREWRLARPDTFRLDTLLRDVYTVSEAWKGAKLSG